MNRILVLITQLLTAMAILFVSFGMDYISIGTGLQPILAGALALSSLLLPYLAAEYMFNKQADCIAEGDEIIDEYQEKYGPITQFTHE